VLIAEQTRQTVQRNRFPVTQLSGVHFALR